jgi:hypothetical protein
MFNPQLGLVLSRPCIPCPPATGPRIQTALPPRSPAPGGAGLQPARAWGDWQPLAARGSSRALPRGGMMFLALMVGRGRLFQFRPTVSAIVNDEQSPAVTRSPGTKSH